MRMLLDKNRDRISPVEGTEGGRRPSGVPSTVANPAGDQRPATPPDPEVTEKPVRRRFTAEYKLRILAEADRCTKPGQIGALLRREGLYWSNLSNWRRKRREGTLGTLSPVKRDPKAVKNPLAPKVAQLEREVDRLKAKLQQAETIIDVQKKVSGLLGIDPESPEPGARREELITAAEGLSQQVGVSPACRALAVSRATLYRRRTASLELNVPVVRPTTARALSPDEKQLVLDVLNSDRFCDMSPAAVHATLLDEGKYHCSARTTYRVLSEAGEVKERRNQLRHPKYTKPELLATMPNQVWSWDITKLKGPAKWTYYYLSVILDIFSRYVVGWMIAMRETGTLAEKLISETCSKQGIEEGLLTLHADRGSPMKSKPVEFLLVDLGVDKTHSRPHTSNDNPYSESQFKTLKYRPEFPRRFGSIQDARSFCRKFFTWYNTEHRHSGISYLTPEMVHYGHADDVLDARRIVLRDAYDDHPERFVNKKPKPLALPESVWINKPEREVESDVVLH